MAAPPSSSSLSLAQRSGVSAGHYCFWSSHLPSRPFPPSLHSPHPHSMPWFYCILIPLFTGSILSTYKHSELWNLYTTPLPLQSPPSFPPWISPRRQTEGLPHCLWPTVHWPPPVPLKQYPLTAPPHDQYTHKHSWAPEVSTDQL